MVQLCMLLFSAKSFLFLGLAVISKANVLNKGAAHQDELQNLLFSTLATQSNGI